MNNERKGLRASLGQRAHSAARKVVTCGIAVATAASMVLSAPVAAFAATTTGSGITLDKTASGLDENNETKIQLSLNGASEQTYSDVVFVLDKSTSVDVREAAKAMLGELKLRAGENKIKVGVVVFNKTASEQLGLTDLNDDTYAQVSAALDATPEGGTNINAGLEAGRAMLDADTSVAASAKHLVLVTDGVTYLYGTGETPQTIYTESPSNGEESINAGNDMSGALNSAVTELNDSSMTAAAWLAAHGAGIAQDIETYGHDYGAGQYRADELGHTTDSTYENAGFEEGDYVSGEIASEHATANEAGVYSAIASWQGIVGQGYHAYAFASPRYQSTYPWGSQFVSTLSSIGGASGMVPADTTGMFDAVKSDILYSLGEGSVVTDVMGSGDNYDFDFVNDPSRIAIEVNGQVLTAQEQDGSYVFGNPDSDGVYPYVLTYDEQAHSFTLTFNVPVTDEVVLTYYAKLVEAPTEPGDYQLQTNESATLDPAGDEDPIAFPDPTVDYTVAEPEPEPEEPKDPEQKPTDDTKDDTKKKPSKGKLPQTGDIALAVTAGVAVVGAASAGAGVWFKRRK